MKLSLFGLYKNIGFDLGTSTTLISFDKNAVALCEPSVVALEKGTNKVLAVGSEADEMLGRTPENISAVCPVKDGVVADFTHAAAMIKAFMKRAAGNKPMIKPRVSVAVPGGITDVERHAVIEVFTAAGAHSVVMIEEPMAAALGAGLPVCEAKGTMVVNIGAGTAEAAVMSLGGIVSARSVRGAGDSLDNAISSYIRREYSITVGEKTAREIKAEIGSCRPFTDEGYFEVKGRHTSTGLPKNVNISAKEVREAMADVVNSIVDAVLDTLEDTPPELAADVLSNGIVITGGGAGIRGIDALIEEATGVKTRVADNAATCVCRGALTALFEPSVINRSDVARKR